ncbi:MAG TPA: pyruvate dehydrogenase (acetyl-transferring), homodimeric type, partial [Ottowia sp.]|nr:pyruvate dehydrogenase (acetyl-transferring), homodimeric type [Ottowia sp.]
DVFYYVTLMNENYAQPDLPEGAHEGVLRGCYLFGSYRRTPDGRELPKDSPTVTLLGSGAILTEVILAAELLVRQGIAASVLSVTSWSELARDGMACERRQLDGDVAAGTPWVTQVLAGTRGPVIAATDYVCAVPESVRAFVPEGRRYLTLGTDGFGRSDTRAALRRFFGVDAKAVVRAARRALG